MARVSLGAGRWLYRRAKRRGHAMPDRVGARPGLNSRRQRTGNYFTGKEMCAEVCDKPRH
jgi:hypothetical protein